MVSATRGTRPTRAEKVAANRAALLEAAGRVFRRVGYAGATVDAIAEEAGFTKGAVYSHFESKADLFLSLLEARIDQRARDQRTFLQEHHGPDVVEFLIDQLWLGWSRSDPEWRLLVLEFRLVAARDEDLQARYSAAHQRTIDGVAHTIIGLAEHVGVELDVPPHELAAAVLALDAGGFLEELADPERFSDEFVPVLISRLVGFPITRSES